MFHLFAGVIESLETGVRPGLVGSSWTCWGEVKNLTLNQYRAGVVGDIAASGTREATIGAFKPMNENTVSLFRRDATSNFAGV